MRAYFNIRHMVSDFIEIERPDVLLLNSTYITNSYKIKHYGYTSYQSPDEAHEGVAILIRSSYKHELLHTHWLHKHFLAIKVHTQMGSLIICTTYTRPNTDIPMQDFITLFNNSHLPVFLLADLNAQHPTFHHNTTNQHGRQLHQIYTQKHLFFLGPDFPTCFTHTGSGRPDLIFTNRHGSNLQHFISPGPITGSDHIPLILTVSTNPILIPSTPQFSYHRANWDMFKQHIDDTDLTYEYNDKHHTDIDTQARNIQDTIIHAANISIPKTAHKPHFTFTPSIRSKRLLACYHTRFLQNIHRHGQILWDLTALKNHILNSLDEDHTKHWKHLIEQAEQYRKLTPQEFWKRIKRLQGSTHTPFKYLLHNNNKITDPEAVLNIFKHHWEQIFHPHPPEPFARPNIEIVEDWIHQNRQATTPDDLIHLENLNSNTELQTPLTLADVKTALMGTRRRAPGASGIGHILLRQLPASIITAITNLFNASLASGYFPLNFKSATAVLIPKPGKPHTDPKNYRPISLLETLGKVFERLINQRLRTHLEHNDLLTNKQFGFRPHRSTHDALNIMTNYLSINQHQRLKTALITKDVEKAFDTVWHDGLKFKLCNNFNLPLITTKLLSNYLDNRTMRIKFLQQHSDYFNLNAGVPQGSVLAPTLYILYINDIPDPVHHTSLTICYADDVSHLVTSNTIDTLTNRAQTELDVVTEWEYKWRIKTNSSKSKITYFFCKRTIRPIPLKLYSYTQNPTYISVSPSSTVLGLTFDRQLLFHTHITQKHAIALQAMKKLYRLRFAKPDTKMHLYKALIRPLLTYAPLALSLSARTNKIKLQRIQNRALRWVLNTRWQELNTSQSLHESTNIPALNTYWKTLSDKQIDRLLTHHEQHIDFLLHTLRLPRNNHDLFSTIHDPLPNSVFR